MPMLRTIIQSSASNSLHPVLFDRRYPLRPCLCKGDGRRPAPAVPDCQQTRAGVCGHQCVSRLGLTFRARAGLWHPPPARGTAKAGASSQKWNPQNVSDPLVRVVTLRQ